MPGQGSDGPIGVQLEAIVAVPAGELPLDSVDRIAVVGDLRTGRRRPRVLDAEVGAHGVAAHRPTNGYAELWQVDRAVRVLAVRAFGHPDPTSIGEPRLQVAVPGASTTRPWSPMDAERQASYLFCTQIPNGYGGEGGIRTLDGLSTHTPLAGERLQPLGHLSALRSAFGGSRRRGPSPLFSSQLTRLLSCPACFSRCRTSARQPVPGGYVGGSPPGAPPLPGAP